MNVSLGHKRSLDIWNVIKGKQKINHEWTTIIKAYTEQEALEIAKKQYIKHKKDIAA